MNRSSDATNTNRFWLHATVVSLLLVLSAYSPIAAQTDSITANPNAVKLRRIWMSTSQTQFAQVGTAVGTIGDINHDGLNDVAVLSAVPPQWSIYLGDSIAISHEPVWKFDSGNYVPGRPILGDFWGTGHKSFGFTRIHTEGPNLVEVYSLHLFRTDTATTAPVEAARWSSRQQPSGTLVFPTEIVGADLDGDGDDELLVFSALSTRDSLVNKNRGDIAIYEGGPNFQLDTPTVVLRDPVANWNTNLYRGAVGDVDGDQVVDLLTLAAYRGIGYAIHLYFGRSGLPVDNQQPDRVLYTKGFDLHLSDCDGDGVMDVVTDGVLIFRSGSGKDARTRSYLPEDADITLLGRGHSPTIPGNLNDPTNRYAMIGMIGGSPMGMGDQMLWAFSGGPNGPDHAYDAYYSPGSDGLVPGLLFQSGGAIGDVDGDGWGDAMYGTFQYPHESLQFGRAVILAGGPYIPRDTLQASAIQDVRLESREQALSVWPNPVADRLNIAWRGDLQRKPSRFELYDLLGRSVGRGSIDAGRGEITWSAGHLALGTYRLSVFDKEGLLMTSTSVVRE